MMVIGQDPRVTWAWVPMARLKSLQRPRGGNRKIERYCAMRVRTIGCKRYRLLVPGLGSVRVTGGSVRKEVTWLAIPLEE